MDITDFKNGFVTVPYPIELRRVVDDAMSSWQAFCAMSEESKLQLGNEDRNNDTGYNLRRGEGTKADKKEFFHTCGVWTEDLHKEACLVVDERAAAFVNASQALIEAMKPLVRSFAEAVEREYQADGFADEVMRYSDRWMFRYLHYFGGEMLAHAHPDRGGFTLHLAESEPGGEYLPEGGEWQPWPVSEHQTIIFPSMVLQHRTRCQLKALWHRVKATPVSNKNGRYAIVVFVDFDHPFRYSDKSGRLQEKPVGFNWQMPFEEFEKLFEQR